MKLTDTQQIGVQVQKFGTNLQAAWQQIASIHQHITVLFAVVRVLKDKDIITESEIEEALKKMKEETE